MMAWIERGGPVMWPLLVLSFLAATLVVERLIFWFREARSPARVVVASAWERSSTRRLGHADAAREMGLVIDAEQRRLERFMAIFDTVIAAAPMMGILGTVLGVIGAFDALAFEGSPDPMAVTGGISEALLTTATGLVIALGVLFPYSYFRTRLGERLGELEQAAEELLGTESGS
jgi:biopolymer transport protein ExbB